MRTTRRNLIKMTTIWRASADHTFGCMIDSNRCAPGTYETWSKALAHADKLVATVGDGHWTADQATAVMNTYSDGYVMLAAFASLLLIVPFVALAGSAARLAASRRDARLAALSLAGATPAQVTKLTALDAGGQALLGALVGMAGYFALIPAILRHGPDSYGRQQWGILHNGGNSDAATPRE